MAAVAEIKNVGLEEAREAAGRVAKAFDKTAALPSHARARVLSEVSGTIAKESEAFAKLICEEVKKPLKEARREVARAVFTFQWAGEEAKRFGGELLPLDLDQATEGRVALTKRVARGPALFIAPFNFPLNLVAHKVAPAIAVGVPFVLKPPPQAPRTSMKLGEIILKAGWPADAIAVCPADNAVAEELVRDERFAILSFTGSAGVGWKLKSIAGKKAVFLELGGNASVFVGSDADLPWAAARCAWGAYYYSGQVCISVQRMFVEAPVYEDFKKLLLENIVELKIGDPADEKTDIGPLIDARSADRIESWISEAAQAGGKILAGGKRKGEVIPPTLIENVPDRAKLSCEEAFGPVATIEKVESRERALERMAAGRYGLQAGLFTRDMSLIFDAWRRLPVGGLIVNDIPAFRSDAMPYGGVRDSGTGREGARYAMEEFTELRTLVIKP